MNLSLIAIFVVCVAIFATSAFGGLPVGIGIGIMEGAIVLVLLQFNVDIAEGLACALMFRSLYTLAPVILVIVSSAYISVLSKNSCKNLGF